MIVVVMQLVLHQVHNFNELGAPDFSHVTHILDTLRDELIERQTRIPSLDMISAYQQDLGVHEQLLNCRNHSNSAEFNEWARLILSALSNKGWCVIAGVVARAFDGDLSPLYIRYTSKLDPFDALLIVAWRLSECWRTAQTFCRKCCE